MHSAVQHQVVGRGPAERVCRVLGPGRLQPPERVPGRAHAPRREAGPQRSHPHRRPLLPHARDQSTGDYCLNTIAIR